jgi:hypothetical protein
MEFRLLYWGNDLKAAGSDSRVWEKHQIRRGLHYQLKHLWETHPLLQLYSQEMHIKDDVFMQGVVRHRHTRIHQIAEQYEGYVPLVNESFGMFCELNILFLRPEPIGSIVKRGDGGGDIDNRLKVLFDALSVPQRGGLPKLDSENTDPNPMFVLLSDDSLIGSFTIVSDRLLTRKTEEPSEAYVVIHVNVKTSNPLLLPYGINV